ncbi:MAG: hypothetical protein IPK39_14015 [Sulfuritalea sp.]|nr:hypothetical protein [Sulfuritalea sp.]
MALSHHDDGETDDNSTPQSPGGTGFRRERSGTAQIARSATCEVTKALTTTQLNLIQTNDVAALTTTQEW